jgi:hypothetical protein
MTMGSAAAPAQSVRPPSRGAKPSFWSAWAAPALTYVLVAHLLYGLLQPTLLPPVGRRAADGAVQEDLWTPMAGAWAEGHS